MNKFKSFGFEDAAGINALIEKYPLAGGTNVFSSEGKLIIQYQDGEDEPRPVQIVNLKEQIRAFEKNKAEIVHSNRVMDTLIADAKSRAEVAEADVKRLEAAIETATSNKEKKTLQDELALAAKTLTDRKGGLHEAKTQKLLNDNEVSRIDLNIELFKEQIAELSN